jgi:hypothetical protein
MNKRNKDESKRLRIETVFTTAIDELKYKIRHMVEKQFVNFYTCKYDT